MGILNWLPLPLFLVIICIKNNSPMMKKSGRRDDKLVLRQLRQSHHRRPLPAHLPREVKRLEPTESFYPECRGERDYLSEVSAEQLEGLSLFTKTQLLVFLTEGFSLLREQPFQFCNANKVFLTHGRFIMRP